MCTLLLADLLEPYATMSQVAAEDGPPLPNAYLKMRARNNAKNRKWRAKVQQQEAGAARASLGVSPFCVNTIGPVLDAYTTCLHNRRHCRPPRRWKRPSGSDAGCATQSARGTAGQKI